MKFRFTFTSDSINTNKDGWMIDDINISCIGTGINEISKNAPFSVYPNPTTGFISILPNKSEIFRSATLINILGKPILTEYDPTFNLSQFEAGLYFLAITSDRVKYVTRVIIE